MTYSVMYDCRLLRFAAAKLNLDLTMISNHKADVICYYKSKVASGEFITEIRILCEKWDASMMHHSAVLWMS